MAAPSTTAEAVSSTMTTTMPPPLPSSFSPSSKLNPSSSPLRHPFSRYSSALPVRRSDQLDAPYVDAHLLSLLLPRIRGMFKYLPPISEWTHGGEGIVSGGVGVAAGVFVANTAARTVAAVAEFLRRHGDVLLAALLHVTTALVATDARLESVTTPACRALGMCMVPSSATAVDKEKKKVVAQRGGMDPGLRRGSGIAGRAVAFVLLSVVLPESYRRWRRKWDEEEENDARRRSRRRRRRSSADSWEGEEDEGEEYSDGAATRTTTAATSAFAMSRMELTARRRRRLVINAILRIVDHVLPLVRLWNYCVFLLGDGVFNRAAAPALQPPPTTSANISSPPPTLAMRLAGLRYAPLAPLDDSNPQSQQQQQHHRHATFAYAHRRLLCDEAFRTVAALSTILPAVVVPPSLLALGRGARGTVAGEETTARSAAATPVRPLASIRSRMGTLSRRMRRWGVFGGPDLWSPSPSPSTHGDGSTGVAGGEKPAPRLERSPCAICYAVDSSVPYVASCGHTFCYVCLRLAVTDDLGYRCPECGKAVSSSRPLSRSA